MSVAWRAVMQGGVAHVFVELIQMSCHQRDLGRWWRIRLRTSFPPIQHLSPGKQPLLSTRKLLLLKVKGEDFARCRSDAHRLQERQLREFADKH